MLKKIIVFMLIASIAAAPVVQAMDRAAVTARAAEMKAAIMAVQKKQAEDKRKGFFGQLKDRVRALVKKAVAPAMAANVQDGQAAPEQAVLDTRCGICHSDLVKDPLTDELVDAPQITKLKCHCITTRYHTSCINSWLDMSNKCPYCSDKVPVPVLTSIKIAAAGAVNQLVHYAHAADHAVIRASAYATSALKNGAQFVADNKGKVAVATTLVAAVVAAKYAMDNYAGEPVFFGPEDGLNHDSQGVCRTFSDFCWKFLRCNETEGGEPMNEWRHLRDCDFKRIYDFCQVGVSDSVTRVRDGIVPLYQIWFEPACERYLARVRGY